MPRARRTVLARARAAAVADALVGRKVPRGALRVRVLGDTIAVERPRGPQNRRVDFDLAAA